MFSVKKIVFLLALLLTLLPTVAARPAFAQEGMWEEGVQVEEGVEEGVGGEEVMEDELVCITLPYTVRGFAPHSEPVVAQFFLNSGCDGTVRVTTDRGTYMRAIAAGRAPGAWVHVPVGQTITIAAWLPAGTWVTVQLRHIDPQTKTFNVTVRR